MIELDAGISTICRHGLCQQHLLCCVRQVRPVPAGQQALATYMPMQVVPLHQQGQLLCC